MYTEKISWVDKIKLLYHVIVYGDSFLKRHCEQRLSCIKREREMDACKRPKTYPKVPKDARVPTYTDYFGE